MRVETFQLTRWWQRWAHQWAALWPVDADQTSRAGSTLGGRVHMDEPWSRWP
jgi:hypothetical protein